MWETGTIELVKQYYAFVTYADTLPGLGWIYCPPDYWFKIDTSLVFILQTTNLTLYPGEIAARPVMDMTML